MGWIKGIMSNFDESAFRTKVEDALTVVKKILDNTRDPKLPADVPHQVLIVTPVHSILTQLC